MYLIPDGIRYIFFFGIRYIVLDIGKYEFSVLGAMYLIPKFYPCIYIQIGIDLVAENRNMNPNLIDWIFLFIIRLSEGLY